MFFPEKITKIKQGDKVLEVGPGADPYPRSDVYLERKFDSKTAFIQNGFSKSNVNTKKTVYYNGGKFPFHNNEFDYVICSHVLEHVPWSELPQFISELQRVAKSGYLEFPNIFYELINYQRVHLWLMNYRDGTIYFLDKSKLKDNYVWQSYREMFLGKDTHMQQSFDRYKEFFFCSFEWENKINYKREDDLNELINKSDYLKVKKYFSSFKVIAQNLDGKEVNFLMTYLSIITKSISRLLNKKQYFTAINSPPIIAETAILGEPELITLGKSSEIKDYCIIRPNGAKILIGDYTQINPFTVIYGHSPISIGSNVMIAPQCILVAGNHDYKQTDVPMLKAGNLTKGPLIIEDNVWIGAGSIILDGVKIGYGAVVGAGSVVTKDVASFSVVAGNPAKVISLRKKV